MRRIFIDGTLSDEITVCGELARHLGYALRSRPGDTIRVTDSAGRSALMAMTAFAAERVTLRRQRWLREPGNAAPLRLALALLKGDRFEHVVQKATELGASEIQPLVCARCVVRYEARKAAERGQRWQRIAAEAAQQCGRADVPAVLPIATLPEWLATIRAGDGVALCYEADSCESSLKAWLREQRDLASPLTLVVGCEGGFGADEVAAARSRGVAIVGLGRRILRAETAAVVAVALAQYERGELE